MWSVLLSGFLNRIIREGQLVLRFGDGVERRFGRANGPIIRVHLRDAATARRLVLDPELALGECYMEGALSIEGDDVQGLLALVTRNVADRADMTLPARTMGMLRQWRRRLDQANPAGRAQRNVAHHYDLTPEIYDLFLDADRQYSCAYFTDPGQTLEAAQQAKTTHIARKLLIAPGMRVLDIGCGWGGLALSLARDHGAEVTGITLSHEQLEVARARAAAAGLSGRVRFELMDYRAITGQFDRIVSVGMFEHVGAPNFLSYFRTVRARLVEDGVALIHSIGRTAPPKATNPWIAKYIFPGGYVPSLSEALRAVEESGLRIGDVECLRLHYALTLRHWFDRFSAKAARAEALKDRQFVRMWRFYLAACEQTFRHGPQDVFQLQLCRRADAVPITRDYLYPARVEPALRAAE